MFADRVHGFHNRKSFVKGHNLGFEEEYAAIDKRGDPDFIEPKGYVYVGYSRERLSMDNMPSFDDILGFVKRMSELTGYEITGENRPSRVVLLSNGRKTMLI